MSAELVNHDIQLTPLQQLDVKLKNLKALENSEDTLMAAVKKQLETLQKKQEVLREEIIQYATEQQKVVWPTNTKTKHLTHGTLTLSGTTVILNGSKKEVTKDNTDLYKLANSKKGKPLVNLSLNKRNVISRINQGLMPPGFKSWKTKMVNTVKVETKPDEPKAEMTVLD